MRVEQLGASLEAGTIIEASQSLDAKLSEFAVNLLDSIMLDGEKFRGSLGRIAQGASVSKNSQVFDTQGYVSEAKVFLKTLKPDGSIDDATVRTLASFFEAKTQPGPDTTSWILVANIVFKALETLKIENEHRPIDS